MTGIKVPIMVAEQPLGIDACLAGARNRLKAMLEMEVDADLAVSVENGIVCIREDGDEERWVDLAVVVLRDLHTENEAFATSAGVFVSTDYIGEWCENGAEGTIGELIAEKMHCDKQDPHSALTKSQFPRAKLLEHAICVAASTLP